MKHLSRRRRTRSVRCVRIWNSTRASCISRWGCPRNSLPRLLRPRAFSAGRPTSWNNARTTGSSGRPQTTSALLPNRINFKILERQLRHKRPAFIPGNIECMLFSETLASMQPLDRGWRAHIGKDWSQGRAAFGGMVAALGNEAMRRLVPAERELRGLETTFVGPALAGEVRIEAEVLRVGKAVTIASARLWSDGKIAATLTGVYGSARATALSITPSVAAGVRPADGLPELSGADMGGPSFVQHFGYRWSESSRPFGGTSLRPSQTDIRHTDSAPLTV